MQAHADDQPAVAVRFVEIQADALVIIGRGGNERKGFRISGEVVEESCAERFEIHAFFKGGAKLRGFFRLGRSR